MIDEKTFNGIVGQPPKKKSYSLRDSDGDGVINIKDCQPHNPKEQGLIDTFKEKVAAARERGAEKREARDIERAKEREERFVRESKSREAAKEERGKQEVKTAVFKEQQRGEQRRETIKSKPSVSFGSLLMGSPIAKPQTRTIRRRVKVKGKKGKTKLVTRQVAVKEQPKTIPTLFSSSSTVDKNRDGIPDFLGGSSKKKGKGDIPKFF